MNNRSKIHEGNLKIVLTVVKGLKTVLHAISTLKQFTLEN